MSQHPPVPFKVGENFGRVKRAVKSTLGDSAKHFSVVLFEDLTKPPMLRFSDLSPAFSKRRKT